MLILGILVVGGVVYVGLGVAYVLVALLFKLIRLGVQLLLGLGKGVLIAAVLIAFLALKLMGLLALTVMVLLALGAVWMAGRLFGCGRKTAARPVLRPAYETAGAGAGGYYARQASRYHEKLRRLEQRLENLETIISVR